MNRSGTSHMLFVNRAVAFGRSVLSLGQRGVTSCIAAHWAGCLPVHLLVS